MEIVVREMKKSTTMMTTRAKTTAFVVDEPRR
jgi:hypothetical protein